MESLLILSHRRHCARDQRQSIQYVRVGSIAFGDHRLNGNGNPSRFNESAVELSGEVSITTNDVP